MTSEVQHVTLWWLYVPPNRICYLIFSLSFHFESDYHVIYIFLGKQRDNLSHPYVFIECFTLVILLHKGKVLYS